MVKIELFLRWLEFAIKRVGPGYYGQSERVYCYELYHHLRLAMHFHANSAEPLKRLLLHSEIVKLIPTGEQMLRWKIHPLDGQRSPDFILHEPGTFDNQIVAMEVKTGPKLSYAAFLDDIAKLDQLRSNFVFENVIFHTIEINIDRLKTRVERALEQQALPEKPITMVIKEDYESDIIITNTEELLQL